MFLDINSEEFQGYVNSQMMASVGMMPSNQNYRQVLSTLKFELTQKQVPDIDMITRFGYADDKIILDLGTDTNECIEITPDGYKVIPQPDVLLERNENILPIDAILPDQSGLRSIDEMFDILNVKDEFDKIFLQIVLISYLDFNISTPAIYFSGKEGSGKTFTAKALKNVFDPCRSGSFLNKNIGDLVLYLNKSGIGFIDNFSGLSGEVQNNLCLGYTDGSFTKRKAYEDTKTITLQLKCPLILCSVNISTKLNPDFVSRTAFFNIQRPEKLEAEDVLIKKLNRLYPAVRGELCNMMTKCLTIRDTFKPLNIKRYADFDKLGQAFCQVAFDDSELYKKIILDRAAKDKMVLVKSDDVVDEFANYVKNKNIVCFTMSELKSELMNQTENPAVTAILPNHLSNRIHSAKDFLKMNGVHVFEGTKLSNRYVNGQVYMACTDDYLTSSNIAAERFSPPVVSEMYLKQYQDEFVNSIIYSK